MFVKLNRQAIKSIDFWLSLKSCCIFLLVVYLIIATSYHAQTYNFDRYYKNSYTQNWNNWDKQFLGLGRLQGHDKQHKELEQKLQQVGENRTYFKKFSILFFAIFMRQCFLIALQELLSTYASQKLYVNSEMTKRRKNTTDQYGIYENCEK